MPVKLPEPKARSCGWAYFHLPYFFNKELANQNIKKNAMDGIKESCKKFGLFPNINFIIGNSIAIPKAVNNAL